MTKIPHPKSPPVGYIALDEQTRKFFPKKEHNGPIASLFHLDCPSVRERVFAGRRATMLTGERVLLLQQLKTPHSGPTVDQGAVFVGDATMLHSFETAPTAPHIMEFWRREMFNAHSHQPHFNEHSLSPEERGRQSRLLRALWGAHPLPIYPGHIARCFLPPFSGLGALIWERDEASLIDLRSPRKAYRICAARPEPLLGETLTGQNPNCNARFGNDTIGEEPLEMRFEFHSGSVDITRLVSGLEVTFLRQTPTKALVDLPTQVFLAFYKEQSLNAHTIFHHALNFYALGEEERSLRVFGHVVERRDKALRRLRRLFMEYLVNQGSADDPEPLIWRPLMQSLSLLGQPYSDGGYRPIPLPDELKKGRASICRDLGLHPAIVKRCMQGQTYLTPRLGYEWARQFAFSVTRPTDGHELFVLASKIDDDD